MSSKLRWLRVFQEPRLQLRFLGILIAGNLLQIGVCGVILYYFLRQNYLLLIKYGGLDPQISAVLQRELEILIWIIGANFLVFLIGTAVLGFVFSQRVTGVLGWFRRAIAEISAGRELEVRMRQNDEFGDLVEAFQRMVQNLKAPEKPRSKSAS